MTNHLMQNNSYPQSVNPEVSRMQPQFSNHDEIDLKELLLTLWQGKWLIFCSTILVGCLALIYALVAPEVWTSSAKVMEPMINDYYQLTAEVKKYQPVFSEESDDGVKAKKNGELNSLVQSDVLFTQFIYAFNSSINKKAFLGNNSIYKQYLANNEISEDKSDNVLKKWIENIKVVTEKRKRGNSLDFHILSFTSSSQESSYLLLKEYIDYINSLVYKQVVDGINKTITSYTEELQTTSRLLTEKALNRLEMEKMKTDVAFQITAQAAIDEPILSYNNDDLFQIYLGKNANLAKKDALKSITDLSIFEPDLIMLNSKLKFLSVNKQIDPDVKFSTVRYIDEINRPLSKDKPKRMLIVVLGSLLGAMLGVVYVLLRQTFKD